MPLYEHVFLCRHDISQAQVETLAGNFRKIIEDAEGKVTKSEYWGLKALAYKIKKNRKAHFTLLNIDADPAAVAEMERQMTLADEVLRHMTLRVDELDDKPSVMMRADKDDRRGGRRGPPRDRGPRDRGDGDFRGGGGGGGGGDRERDRSPRDEG